MWGRRISHSCRRTRVIRNPEPRYNALDGSSTDTAMCHISACEEWQFMAQPGPSVGAGCRSANSRIPDGPGFDGPKVGSSPHCRPDLNRSRMHAPDPMQTFESEMFGSLGRCQLIGKSSA
jgi:hypothetical protein